jgi:hypothetical protein
MHMAGLPDADAARVFAHDDPLAKGSCCTYSSMLEFQKACNTPGSA